MTSPAPLKVTVSPPHERLHFTRCDTMMLCWHRDLSSRVQVGAMAGECVTQIGRKHDPVPVGLASRGFRFFALHVRLEACAMRHPEMKHGGNQGDGDKLSPSCEVCDLLDRFTAETATRMRQLTGITVTGTGTVTGGAGARAAVLRLGDEPGIASGRDPRNVAGAEESGDAGNRC